MRVKHACRVVTTEELAYIAKKTSEFPRRVRELRTEQGYPISTRFTGRPDLRVGQYVLESSERLLGVHERRIPEAVQKTVYARDANTCRLCAWNRDRWSVDDPRILELHHLKPHKDRGANEEDNLIVLCSKCHDAVHSGEYERELESIRNQL